MEEARAAVIRAANESNDVVDMTDEPDVPKIRLARSGLEVDENDVLGPVRAKYVEQYKTAAKVVETNHSIRGKLEDIAKLAADETKARLIDRHPDWFADLEAAVKVVDEDYKATSRARKQLKLPKALELFDRLILRPAYKKSVVADDAEEMAKNLIEDLQDHLRD